VKKKDHAVFMLVMAALLCVLCSCGKELAGGSSDSGNARVAAVVYTKDGGRAAGASVIVCSGNYLSGIQNDSTQANGASIRKTMTDDSGRFSIDSVDSGDYFIEVNDRVSSAALSEVIVPLHPNRLITYVDTVRPFAGIAGNSGRSNAPSEERSLLAYGIDRRVPIDSAGNFSLVNLPAGTFRFRIVSSDAAVGPVDIDGMALTSGKTLSVPFMEWRHRVRMLLNTAASGADVKGDVRGFPVLVRLTNANFPFGEASAGGTDCRFTKSDGAPLPFEIEQWDVLKGQAAVWVKTDTIFGNDDAQYLDLYWGNPRAALLSNGKAVFDTADGFQGVWHLSETVLDSAKDATSNCFNGTSQGMDAGAVAGGMVGAARSFNGVSTGISIPNSASGKLNFSEDDYYSVSAWVYCDFLDSISQVVISKGDEQYFLCSVYKSLNSSLWNFDEFNDGIGWEVSSWPVSSKTWVYIIGVRKGQAQFLYINGQLVDSTIELTPALKPRIESFDVAIGKFMRTDPNEDARLFHGIIDEVRIHNVSLSADWIRLCYMNQRSDDKLVMFK
jgi:hypothetical protein